MQRGRRSSHFSCLHSLFALLLLLAGANPSTFFQFARRAPRVKQEKVRQDLLPTYYFPARAVIYSQSARGDKLRCVRALTNCGGAERTVNNIARRRCIQLVCLRVQIIFGRWIINQRRKSYKIFATCGEVLVNCHWITLGIQMKKSRLVISSLLNFFKSTSN